MSRWLHPVERAFNSFLRSPLSVRKAMGVIVTSTVVVVVLGGVLITLVDPDEFPDIGTGMWWSLQTVTTVGYGDVTPHDVVGRLVGAVIMLEAIAFIAIVTAAITSNFVERARRQSEATERHQPDDETSAMPSNAELAAQLATVTAQLERIQMALDRERAASPPGAEGQQ
jgi:voltage-gated potassium channel